VIRENLGSFLLRRTNFDLTPSWVPGDCRGHKKLPLIFYLRQEMSRKKWGSQTIFILLSRDWASELASNNVRLVVLRIPLAEYR
jgi:hypothetical protein